MDPTLRCSSISKSSIPFLILFALGSEGRANTIQWEVIKSGAERNKGSDVQWTDLTQLAPIPPIEQSTITWTEVDESNENESSAP